MKFSSLALVSLVVVAGFSTNALAEQTRTSSGTLVAVIDIGEIFKVHPTFKANMEALQEKAREIESQLAAQQKDLAARGQQLKNLKTSSPEYRKLESELAQSVTDLQVKARQHQKEFVEKEARQYLETYNELLASIQRVATSYGIGLVMRFDSRAIDPNSPQSIALGLKRDVVWQRNLDITTLVLKDLGINTHELPGESPVAGRSSTTRR